MKRTTVDTEMKDPAMLNRALAALGVSFREDGHRVSLLSEDWEGVVIDTKTGSIACATSQAARAKTLRRHYAEAQFWAEAARQGIEVMSQSLHGRPLTRSDVCT